MDDLTPPRLCAPFLEAAAAALEVVRRPAVTDGWSRPSALPAMTVGALAGHLAGQVAATETTLDHPVEGPGPVPVLEHYTKVAWRGAPLDQETNQTIRNAAARAASVGAGELHRSALAALDRLRDRLPGMSGRTLVQPPWTSWSLLLDDFLHTRLVELTVHLDDLLASVGGDAAPLPDTATVPVRHLLVDLAAQRHGDVAVLRALSRAERAPGTIAAF